MKSAHSRKFSDKGKAKTFTWHIASEEIGFMRHNAALNAMEGTNPDCSCLSRIQPSHSQPTSNKRTKP